MVIGGGSHLHVVPCRVLVGDVQANARRRPDVEAGSRDRGFCGVVVPLEEVGAA
jgi:hypothetical protein